MTEFFDLTRSDLEAACAVVGVPTSHACNLFRASFKKGSLRPWREPGFPKLLREALDAKFLDSGLTIASEHLSAYDNSVKFVLKLADGERIEMVLMPESKRITLCISSQVGCGQGCTFCHTGRMGLLRNLTTAEIVGQVAMANRWITAHMEWLQSCGLPAHHRVTNIVFMGMGEPLDNVDAVARAITILADPYGPAIAKRRISVSTAGHLDGLDKMLAIHPDVRLAISVHSADSSERSRIMPINRRWPLADLMDRLRMLKTQQEVGILLQYTLIRGVNDSIEHAKKLIDLVSGMNVKINIIPLNPVGPSRFNSPEKESVETFRDEIYRAGLRVMVRYSKGQDIGAACGQLALQGQNSDSLNAVPGQ